MKGSMVFLVLVILVLCWEFVLSPGELEFTDRAKVLQGLSLARDYKQAVGEYWKANGVLPDAKDWREGGVTADISQSIVESIRVGADAPGVISVHYTDKPEIDVHRTIVGTWIRLVPEVRNDELVWYCEGTVPEDYLPGKCRRLNTREEGSATD